MFNKQRYAVAAVATLCPLACAAPETGERIDDVRQAISPHDFDVDFQGCTEFVGIGLVSAANARALVPLTYDLEGDGTQAILVVRAVQCDDVSVDGKNPKAAKLSQIGVIVEPVDPSADINNYTLWYVTDSGQLKGKLTAAGVETDTEPQFDFTFQPGGSGSGTIQVASSPPQAPAYQANGTAIVPTAAPTTFVASWWAEGQHGTVLMRTEFPAIQFSGATVTLTTQTGSDLANLIGGTSLTFPVLDSYNAFDDAHMEVFEVP